MLPIILASSSPYRQQLLARLNQPFECVNPDIDESAHHKETPEALVTRLAREKTLKVASSHPNHLIIGSDQVACLEGRLLNKPGNHQRASQQLQQCNGKTVRFFTGLNLLNSQTGNYQQKVCSFDVIFRQLSAAQIERYLLAEQPYDCAGSFKMEGLGICLFEKLSGDDPNSLIGLPLIALVSMLEKEGVTLP